MQPLSRFVVALFLLIVTSFIQDTATENEELQAFKEQPKLKKVSAEKGISLERKTHCS